MNDASSRIPTSVVALLAAISLGVFIWMLLGYVLPFQDMTHAAMLEARLGRYDASDIDAMRGLLERKPEARDLLVAMHRGPDLILPFVLTAFLFTVLAKLRPAGRYFNRPMHPLMIAAIYVLPFIYGFSDYAENILTDNLFAGGAEWSFAAALLPWASSLKFASLTVCVIVILRFLVYRIVPPRDR
ncbi:hypothetical protein [Rhizobium sp. S163]|uniref:hypothetical protein n=1 Tax=Rhizobium sp. S163 TaxID=3055039 RepID=UPI0025AA1D12|nr:hypothetical protein [Rhizobium sp. S163]MDM9647515.1 hypothetical protein [Rhizobium sp. S163]